MCLAIYKPANVRITKRHLRNGFDANDDGAGFAIAKDGKLQVFKGYFRFKTFWKAYQLYAKDETAIIHFRMATHGVTDMENCHPFEINGGRIAIIHNGILNIKQTDKSRSDTWHFAEGVLAPMFDALPINSPALKYLVETSIGTSNKIVALAADGTHQIFNEECGEWHEGAWYSNSGYKESFFTSWGKGYCSDGYSSYRGYSGGTRPEYSTGSNRESNRDKWLAKLEAEQLADEEEQKRMFPDYEGRAYCAYGDTPEDRRAAAQEILEQQADNQLVEIDYAG